MSDAKPRHFAKVNPDGSLGGLLEYGLPLDETPEGMTALSEDQHRLWRANMQTRRWDAEAGTLVPHDPGPLPVPVPKALVIERLAQAGALRAVRAGLKFGQRDAELTDAELALRERFDAATVVLADDEPLRTVLRRAGVDPGVILRLE